MPQKCTVIPLPAAVNKILWSDSGSHLMIIDNEGHVLIWSRETGIEPLTEVKVNSKIVAADIAANGEFLLLGFDSGAIAIWTWEDGKYQLSDSYDGHDGLSYLKLLGKDSQEHFVSIKYNERGEIRLWNIHESGWLAKFDRFHPTTIRSACSAADFGLVATMSGDGQDSNILKMWHLNSGKLEEYSTHLKGKKAATTVCLSSSAKLLLIASRVNKQPVISVGNLRDPHEPWIELRDHSDDVVSIDVSPDEGCVFSVDKSKSLLMWDIHSATRIAGNRKPPEFSIQVEGVCVNTKTKLVAIVTKRAIEIYDSEYLLGRSSDPRIEWKLPSKESNKDSKDVAITISAPSDTIWARKIVIIGNKGLGKHQLARDLTGDLHGESIASWLTIYRGTRTTGHQKVRDCVWVINDPRRTYHYPVIFFQGAELILIVADANAVAKERLAGAALERNITLTSIDHYLAHASISKVLVTFVGGKTDKNEDWQHNLSDKIKSRCHFRSSLHDVDELIVKHLSGVDSDGFLPAVVADLVDKKAVSAIETQGLIQRNAWLAGLGEDRSNALIGQFAEINGYFWSDSVGGDNWAALKDVCACVDSLASGMSESPASSMINSLLARKGIVIARPPIGPFGPDPEPESIEGLDVRESIAVEGVSFTIANSVLTHFNASYSLTSHRTKLLKSNDVRWLVYYVGFGGESGGIHYQFGFGFDFRIGEVHLVFLAQEQSQAIDAYENMKQSVVRHLKDKHSVQFNDEALGKIVSDNLQELRPIPHILIISWGVNSEKLDSVRTGLLKKSAVRFVEHSQMRNAESPSEYWIVAAAAVLPNSGPEISSVADLIKSSNVKSRVISMMMPGCGVETALKCTRFWREARASILFLEEGWTAEGFQAAWESHAFRFDKGPKVFLSYSNKDLQSSTLELLGRAFLQYGIELVVDANLIGAGDAITPKIKKMIDTSGRVLFLESANSVISKWCQDELKYVESTKCECNSSKLLVAKYSNYNGKSNFSDIKSVDIPNAPDPNAPEWSQSDDFKQAVFKLAKAIWQGKCGNGTRGRFCENCGRFVGEL